MADAVAFGGSCQFGSRETVHPIVGLLGNLRCGVRNPGQVNHRLDVPEQRPPFNGTSQIRDGDNLDRPGKNIRRLPHRRPHHMSGIGEFVDKGSSNKARRTSHKYARHDLLQTKRRDEPIVAGHPASGKATVRQR